jgi:hypothetical protein
MSPECVKIIQAPVHTGLVHRLTENAARNRRDCLGSRAEILLERRYLGI